MQLWWQFVKKLSIRLMDFGQVLGGATSSICPALRWHCHLYHSIENLRSILDLWLIQIKRTILLEDRQGMLAEKNRREQEDIEEILVNTYQILPITTERVTLIRLIIVDHPWIGFKM